MPATEAVALQILRRPGADAIECLLDLLDRHSAVAHPGFLLSARAGFDKPMLTRFA